MEKVIDHLISRELLILSCYEVDNICRFVKCANKRTGQTFFVQISDLSLRAPETFHKTTLKRSSNYIVENNSSLDAIGEDNLYDLIYLEPKQNQYKFLYEQIIRIGHCFRKIDARPIIQSRGILCQMREDNSLCWFETSLNDDDIKFNIVISYKNINLIDNLKVIEEQLHSIIQVARTKQTHSILSIKFHDKLKNRARETDQQIREKQLLRETLSGQVRSLKNKLADLSEKKKEYSQMSYKATHHSLAARDTNKQFEELFTVFLKTVQAIEIVNNELNSLVFKAEKDFHNLYKSIQPFM